MFFVVLICLPGPTQTCVTLLSELDGKGDIVEACREFCIGIQTKRRAIKEMEPEFFNNFLKGKDNDFSAGHETGCPFLFLPPLNSLFSDFKPITAMIMVKTEMERSLTIQIYLNQSHSYIKDVKLGLGNPEFMHTMNLFLSMLIFY